MVNGMQGGDPDDMDRVAGVIDEQRENVEQALRDLEGKVSQLIPDIWNGADAEKFVGEFESDVKRQFEDAIDRMQQAADELRQQANQQRGTSAS